MKKIIYSALAFAAVAFAACDDESYNDWATPVQNAQEAAKSVALTADAAAAVDYANISGDSVKVFTPALTINDEAAAFSNYDVKFENGTVIKADAQGRVSAAELKDVVENIYGKAPVERTLQATATAFVSRDGQSVKTAPTDITIKVTLVAPITSRLTTLSVHTLAGASRLLQLLSSAVQMSQLAYTTILYSLSQFLLLLTRMVLVPTTGSVSCHSLLLRRPTGRALSVL